MHHFLYFFLLLFFKEAICGPRGPGDDLFGMFLNSESIDRLLRNDELECIPRLTCEAASKQRRSTFSISPDLMTWLSQVAGLDSPMWNLARSALVGLNNPGDIYSCWKAYPKCPRDQSQLLYYLNNHRGGFFRGFQHPYFKNGINGEARIVNKDLSSYFDINSNNGDFLNFLKPLRDNRKIKFTDNEAFLSPVLPSDRLPAYAMKFPNDGGNTRFFPNS